jgi:hypothetical protein
MNLIGSVAQQLQQKENKVSFLIRTAALLAINRATGEMNNHLAIRREAQLNKRT